MMFTVVRGSILVMYFLASSSFSTYSPPESREMLERAWHRELRSVGGEEALGLFIFLSRDLTLVMAIRERISSSSSSSFSSADVSLKYSSVLKNSSGVDGVDVMVVLQPIAGFGNKPLTQQEMEFAENGKDYNDNLLINSYERYDEYSKNLEKLDACKANLI